MPTAVNINLVDDHLNLTALTRTASDPTGMTIDMDRAPKLILIVENYTAGDEDITINYPAGKQNFDTAIAKVVTIPTATSIKLFVLDIPPGIRGAGNILNIDCPAGLQFTAYTWNSTPRR